MTGKKVYLRAEFIIALLIGLNGVVNLLTGMTFLFKFGNSAELREVTQYIQVTDATRLSGLASIILGLVLIALAKGLFNRQSSALAGTVLVLAVLMTNNLLRGTTPHTSVFSAGLLAGLIVYRRRFSVRIERRRALPHLFALVTVAFALAYGSVGTYLLRNEFKGVASWTDAVYFTFVTFSTLGYGDVLPETTDAKTFVVSMVIIGISSFITALGVVVGPLIESHVKGVMRMVSRFQEIRNHVIVCGYSNVGESVVDELRDRDTPYLIVSDVHDLCARLEAKGHNVLCGDPTKAEILRECGLLRARALVVALDNDSVNTMVALTANDIRKEEPSSRFRIVVRIEDEDNIEKVRRFGADEVVSPSTLGGRMMGKKALDAK